MSSSINNAPVLTPEEILQQLRFLRTQILLHEPQTKAPGRNLAFVDPQFTQAAITAAGKSETVRTAIGRSDADLKQEHELTTRWTEVAVELRGLLRNVVAANLVRKQRVGLAALQTYKICEQLARDESQQARIGESLEEMRRFNKFGRKRRTATPAVEAAAKPSTS